MTCQVVTMTEDFALLLPIPTCSIGASLFLLTCVYLLAIPSNRRLVRYWIFYLMGLICTSMIWFPQNGSRGGINVFYLSLTLFALIFTPTRAHWKYILSTIVTLIVLYVLEIRYPSWLDTTIDDQTLYIDSIFSYGALFIATVAGITFLKKNLDRQRDFVEKKK